MKARFMHALSIGARNFGAWLAGLHAALSIHFAKSLAVAAIAGGVAAAVDFLTHGVPA